MRKPYFISVTFALLSTLGLTFFSGLSAQSAPSAANSSQLKVGMVTVVARHSEYQPGLLHLWGQVKVTSDNYDFTGEDVKLYSPPSTKGSKANLKRAVIEGDPASNKQVYVYLRQDLEGRSCEIFADHALYTPDTSRPGGGEMDFTGHVKVITHSGFLAEPSETTTDKAVILMGQGEDYPQVSTGPAHIVLTPAQ